MKTGFTVKKFTENIYGFGEFYHSEKVISYLIIGKVEALLFDTGMGIFDIKKEIRKITKLPIIVVNSHFHFDHVGGNYLFDDVRIFNHKLIKNISENGIKNSEIQKYFTDKNFYKKPKEFDLEKFEIQKFKYKQLLGDNEIIDLEPFSFSIVHTPGHTKDSICLYEENLGYLFSGDFLYFGPIFIEDLPQYLGSIKRLSKLKIKKIFPGHNDFSISSEIIKDIEKLEIKELKEGEKIQVEKDTFLVKT